MRLTLFAALLGCAFFVAPAQAAFTVRVESGTATVGGSNSLAVWVSSDNPGGEWLDSFGLELRITRTAGSGSLQFVDPQSGAELPQPNYVFGLDSANASVGPPTSFISTTSATNDTFLGGDGTLSNSGVLVDGTERLLTVIDLDASGAVAGDTYRIEVIGSGTGIDTTFFANPNLESYNWNQTDGTVTISGLNAVPAPPGFTLALSGLVPLLGWAIRSRRRSV